MKKLLFILIISTSLLNASCKDVGTQDGLQYVKTFQDWADASLAVKVCAKGKFRYIISLKGITQPSVKLTKKEFKDIIKNLTKVPKMIQTAQFEKSERVNKTLYSSFNLLGEGRNSLVLNLFSTKKGKQTDITFDLIDKDNLFTKGEIYIPITKLQNLIELLEKAKKMYKEF